TSESIRRGLFSRFRTLGRAYQKDDIEEILEILAHPDEVVTQDWLLIYDNADDPDLDLRDYIPHCDHGSIFITTRNPGLGDLSPQCHLKLETMSEDEAVHALLTAALPSGTKPSDD
ncbi:13164_t:CDS:1, partial [Acaulospora colombiana]